MEKVDLDEPPLSIGRGENHTPLGKGGYFRLGSIPDILAASRTALNCGQDCRWLGWGEP